MKKLKISVTSIVALLIGAVPGAAGPYVSTYTNVDECRARDLQPDEFVVFCKGPAGLAATLHYFDGRAWVGFGPGSGEHGDEAGPASIGDPRPIMVGGDGKVFGPRIEWMAKAGQPPCAAIVRVASDKGSVLVTTSLVGTGRATAESKTNDAARLAGEQACTSTSPTESEDAGTATTKPESPERPQPAAPVEDLKWATPIPQSARSWLNKFYNRDYVAMHDRNIDWDAPPFRFAYANLDERSSGPPAIIVHWKSSDFCGSAGCAFDVWIPNGDDYKQAMGINGSELTLGKGHQLGMRDLWIDENRHRWDGHQYERR